MPAPLTIKPPPGYSLARDVCSYGYFLLAPNHWLVRERALLRPFVLGARPAGVMITQPKGAGAPLRLSPSRTLSSPERASLERQVRRMLRLDEPAGAIAAFHRLDPRWKQSGRGRLFRSPTFFEDVVKTVTSCNVQWPGTIQMNRRLCEVLGRPVRAGDALVHTFPDPARLARARPSTLRARCRTGYRDQRLVALGRLFAASPSRGGVDVEWFEDPATPSDALHQQLLEWPRLGPYAAANILQLLGRYERLPLDTESVRHGRTFLGLKGTPAQVMRGVKEHFAPFAEHAFRSYWLEMWEFYESKHGPAWTWERDTTGRLFTAALLNKPAPGARRRPKARPAE